MVYDGPYSSVWGGIDGSRVDGIPAKDQGSTLFEGPSEAEVVNKMLNPFSKGQ